MQVERPHEINEDIEVIPGQLIAMVDTPDYGQEGTTVTGEAILSTKGKLFVVIPGRNTYTSQDGTRIYSAIYGNVFWEDNIVDVERVLHIDKDVTESISFDGNIIIKGDVKKDIKVEAKGSIKISGNVEDAELIAGSSIYIEGEVQGNGKAYLKATRKIKALSIKGATVETINQVTAEDGIINSKVKADRIISDKKGLVINSQLEAGSLIKVKTVGKGSTLTSRIQGELSVKNPNGAIYIINVLYPKASIKIGQISTNIKKPLKKVKFVIERGKISPIKLTQIEETSIQEDYLSFPKEKIVKSPPDNLQIPESVVVEADNEYEAKSLAQKLLNLDKSELEVQRLKINLFRIFKENILGPWQEEWRLKYGPDKDGSFTFENRVDGLYLMVIPAQGNGKRITPAEVVDLAHKKGYENIDLKKVEIACSQRLNEFIKIANRQIVKDAVKVDISKDKLKAYITILTPKEGGLLIKLEDVFYALKRSQIRVPTKQETIVDALHKGKFNEKIEIAEAKLPQEPTQEHDAYIKYRYDAKDRDVIPGQLLIIKVEAKYANPGMNVLGEEIPAKKGKEIKLLAGRNTYSLKYEDELQVYSLIYGRVNFKEITPTDTNIKQIIEVNVDCLIELDEDIDRDYEFDGSLKVKGSIKNDKKIRLGGDLILEGDIEGCEIIAQGEVRINGGINGKCKIKAQNLFANYIKDSLIEVEGLVEVKEAIHQCIIKAKDVVCTGRGGILDSKIEAKQLIKSKIIGHQTKISKQEFKLQDKGKIAAEIGIYPKALVSVGRATLLVKKPIKRAILALSQQRLTALPFEDISFSPYLKEITTSLQEKPNFETSVVLPIELTASSSEAIRKGAELLHIDYNLLEAELLTDKRSYRVHKKQAEGPWLESFYKQYGPKADGEFKLINRKEGLFLILKYPIGKGNPIRIEDIKKELISKNYQKDINYQVIQEALNKQYSPDVPYQEEIKIGPMQFGEELGGRVIIQVSSDKTEATMRIIPPQQGEVLLSVEQIIKELEKFNIKFGIDKQRIADALKNKEYNKEIKIASARLPTQGKDGALIYSFKNRFIL
jgi:uncharacterized protein (DUF342 family)